jgi:hypothetical protein
MAAVGTAGDSRAQTTPPLPQYSAENHLGVTSCSTCHGAVQPFPNSTVLQTEYVTWLQKDRHARAYKVLLDERSVRIARNLGLKNAHEAPECLNCHADNPAADKRGRQFQVSDGVGCEGCHGGSQRYLGPHVSGATHADNIKNGLYPTTNPIALAKLCMSCHVGSEANKFADHRIMGAGHPRISIELDTFRAIQPAHFRVDDDYVNRKGRPNSVQIWAVGQAIQLADTMEAYLDPKRNRPGVFPELVFYDCHACHHPMSNLRYEPRQSAPLPPGSVKFNDSNAIMLRIAASRVDQGLARSLAENTAALHRAMQESRDRALQRAQAVRDIANQLAQRFAQHQFKPEDTRALMDGVIVEGLERREYVDYAAAEQATMALSALINEMKSSGGWNDGQHKQAQTALNRLYEAVSKDEQYRSSNFVAALRGFREAVPR